MSINKYLIAILLTSGQTISISAQITTTSNHQNTLPITTTENPNCLPWPGCASQISNLGETTTTSKAPEEKTENKQLPNGLVQSLEIWWQQLLD